MDKLGIRQIFEGWAAENAPGSSLELIPKVREELEFDARTAPTESRPDMLWAAADFVKPLAMAHLIQPVDNIVDTAQFMPSLTGLVRLNGQTYGIPLQVGNYLM